MLALAFALTISLLALPIAATIATDTHQTHRGVYADQARTRHRASISTQGSTNVVPSSLYPAEGAHRWVRNATPPTRPVELWVDDAGNWVAPPTPPSRAAYDAVGIALALEGLVVMAAAALVVATRWQLCRVRYSQWDRELGRVLSGGGRGHGSNRAP